MENIKEINLTELVSALMRKAWLIVVCAVAAGALTFANTANFITPLYRSSVKIYVNNKQASAISQSNGVSASDLATSQKLVDSYIIFLSSDTVLQEVSKTIQEEHGFYISPAGIRNRMSASAMNETEVFQVYISHSDPERAAIIANAIADVAPSHIANFVEGSSTKIVDRATPAKSPYTPNKTRNTALGMVIGAVVAACVVILQTLLDVRVKGEDDLAAISSAPVLGLIPDLAVDVKGEYGYGGSKGYKAYNSYTADTGSSKEDKA